MIVFSELSKVEKMKYFNFLLENDINFKRDETGNYTALVKVFNPEYFKEKEKKNDTQKNNFEKENTNFDYKSHRAMSARMKITKEENKPKFEKENSQKKVIL